MEQGNRRYQTSPVLCNHTAPTLRPIIDSSNACNQASVPVICHCMDHCKSQLLGVLGLSGRCFPQNCLFHFRNRHPHVTHCSLGHSSSQTHLVRLSHFCMGPECFAMQCIVSGKQKPHNCPFPLGFRHLAGGLIHDNRQHPQNNLVDIQRVVLEISWQRDRQRDTQPC